MDYFFYEHNRMAFDGISSGEYTEEQAKLSFGTNHVLPNYLLALVFSKGKEDFYDYDTFLKLGFFIVNNFNCYIYCDDRCIKDAIDSDIYLNKVLKYDDLGVSIKGYNRPRLDYYHYQDYRLDKTDLKFTQSRRIDELSSYFMEKVIMNKEHVKLLRKVTI